MHSEISQPDQPPRLHGVQLWVALPDGVRDIEPRFESYAELPDLVSAHRRRGVRGKLLLGELDGVALARDHATPRCAAPT